MQSGSTGVGTGTGSGGRPGTPAAPGAEGGLTLGVMLVIRKE